MSRTPNIVAREDRALVDRLLAGDETAFEEFFGGHFPRLYRFALPRVGRDHDAAEEVVQAALCKAVTKMAGYRGEAALFTWLCTFCRHEIYAYHEREGRQPRPVDLADDNPEIAAALDSLWALEGTSPERQLKHKETAQLVQLVLDRLPGRYGDALEWRYAEGLSVTDISRRLGLTYKATESLLSRARVAFRDGFTSCAAAGGEPLESS